MILACLWLQHQFSTSKGNGGNSVVVTTFNDTMTVLTPTHTQSNNNDNNNNNSNHNKTRKNTSDDSKSHSKKVSSSKRKGKIAPPGTLKVVQTLVKLLEKGPFIKLQVDYMIDQCASMQNLKDAIGPYMSKAADAISLSSRSFYAKRACNYIVRYLYLIVFNAYLTYKVDINNNNNSAGTGSNKRDNNSHTVSSAVSVPDTFEGWLDSRKEITHLLRNVTL